MLQFPNRTATQLVAPSRSHRSDFFDQLAQGDIYFVLQQAGARAGASRSNVPLIKDESFHAGFSQMNRHQCPGYSTAYDDRVTRNIAL